MDYTARHYNMDIPLVRALRLEGQTVLFGNGHTSPREAEADPVLGFQALFFFTPH